MRYHLCVSLNEFRWCWCSDRLAQKGSFFDCLIVVTGVCFRHVQFIQKNFLTEKRR